MKLSGALVTIELQECRRRIQPLRKILLGLLWLTVALAPVALALDLAERNVLVSIQNLSFPSNEEMLAAADASDRNQLLMGVSQFSVFIASTIVWFMWIFHSNKLARALGASSMTYSPGWSVGWFFIPIANLFKPYFATKEIYLATMDPKGFDTDRDVEDQPESLNILKLWWLVYLIDRFLSTASGRMSFRADTVEELLTANSLMLASDIATVVAALATIWLVRELSQRQEIGPGNAEEQAELQTTSV